MKNNKEENNRKHTKNCVVTSYDADKNRRLRLSALMRYMQEAGEEQLRTVNQDYEQLYNEGIIFIMTKCAFCITQMPTLAGKFFVTTWHSGATGVQFFREFSVTDESGKVLITATTAWVMIDPQTRKILKRDRFVPGIEEVKDQSASSDLIVQRKAFPNEMEGCGTRFVYWSDIDYNQHINNAVYMDISLDFLPEGFAIDKIKYAKISFLKENTQKNTIKMFAQIVDSEVYIKGENEDGRSFETVFGF